MEAWFNAGFMVGVLLFALYAVNYLFNRYLSKNLDNKGKDNSHDRRHMHMAIPPHGPEEREKI